MRIKKKRQPLLSLPSSNPFGILARRVYAFDYELLSKLLKKIILSAWHFGFKTTIFLSIRQIYIIKRRFLV